MNLKNFHQYVEDKIYSRGRSYTSSVMEIQQVDEGEFCAEVMGSEEYQVFVKLNKKLEIIEHSCDCPYDWGNICKHEVAVFLNIRDKGLHKQKPSESPFHEIKEELEAYDNDELIQVILNMVKRSGKFREDLRWELGLEG